MSLRRLDLEDARRILGESSRLWVGDGTHVVGDRWWATMSGMNTVDYNVVCWSRPDPDLAHGFQIIKDAGVPAVQMLAGPGLAAAQDLSDAGWICIGTTPMMALDLSSIRGWDSDPAVQVAEGERLETVRSVVGETFGITPDLARVAVPDAAGIDDDIEVWTLFEDDVLKSCVATVSVDGVLVGWSMATPKSMQRQGLGRRLLTSILSRRAQEGTAWSLCYASTQGEPLYRALGFETMEHWQIWSRPRWVLSRT